MSEPSNKRQKAKRAPPFSPLLPFSLHELLFSFAKRSGDAQSALRQAQRKYSSLLSPLPWRAYREWLCPLPCLDGRPKEWMPWFPNALDVTGYYLDEPSQLSLQRTYADLQSKTLLAHSAGGGHKGDDNVVEAEEEMELLFRAWFSFPRLILNHADIEGRTARDEDILLHGRNDEEDDEDTAPSPAPPQGMFRLQGRGYVDDQKRFIPRALVAGVSALLPYIWLKLSPDGTALTVRESTIVASDYRIALASSAKGHSLASIHLPVYRRFPRQLAFTTPPVKEKGVFFDGVEKSYALSGGSKALLATLLANDSSLLRKEDDLDPVLSEGKSVIRVKVNFHIDLVVRFNDETGQFDGVTGTHAAPQSMYYVLVEHLERHCLYAFHADDFRGPGEETGLDLHYPHPLAIIREGTGNI